MDILVTFVTLHIQNIPYRSTSGCWVLNTVESSEENKLFREVTEIFFHEEYKYGSKLDDIALLKLGMKFM